jgi:hypothetical protein
VPAITIQKGDITITCEDPATAAAFVRQLTGAEATPPATEAAEPAKRKRRAKTNEEELPPAFRRAPNDATGKTPTIRDHIREAVRAAPEPDWNAVAAKVGTTVQKLKQNVHTMVNAGKLAKRASGGYLVP